MISRTSLEFMSCNKPSTCLAPLLEYPSTWVLRSERRRIGARAGHCRQCRQWQCRHGTCHGARGRPQQLRKNLPPAAPPQPHYAGTTTAMRANVTPRAAANQSCVDLPCGRLLSCVDRALGHAGARHWLGQQVGLPDCVGKSRRGRAGEGRQCPGWASTKRSRWGDGDGYDRRRFYSHFRSTLTTPAGR